LQVAKLLLLSAVFIFSQSSLASELESFQDILLDIKSKKSGSVVQLELFFKNTKSDRLQLKAAYLLAFYGEDELKFLAPEIYADYVLTNHPHLKLGDRILLMRIAGDGFFRKSKFEQAQRIYQQAIDIDTMDSDKKEYFIYRLAWAMVNQDRADVAYHNLKKWLVNASSSSQSHEEAIFIDLGRFFAEGYFQGKLKSEDLISASQLDSAQINYIIAGLQMGQRRFKKSALDFMQLVDRTDWLGHVVPVIQAQLGKDQSDSCAPFALLNSENFVFWKKKELRASSIQCAKKLSPEQKDELGLIVYWYRQLGGDDLADFIALAHLEKKLGHFKQSCEQWIKLAIDDTYSAQFIWNDWLAESAPVCITDQGTNVHFAYFIVDHVSRWNNPQSLSFFVMNQDFPQPFRELLIEKMVELEGFTPLILQSMINLGLDQWSRRLLSHFVEYIFDQKLVDSYQIGVQVLLEVKDHELIENYFRLSYEVIEGTPALWTEYLLSVVDENQADWLQATLKSLPSSRYKKSILALHDLPKNLENTDFELIKLATQQTPLNGDLEALKKVVSGQVQQNCLQNQHCDLEQTLERLSASLQLVSYRSWQSEVLKNRAQKKLRDLIDLVIKDKRLKSENLQDWPMVKKELSLWKQKII
jgi:hypothetical protein